MFEDYKKTLNKFNSHFYSPDNPSISSFKLSVKGYEGRDVFREATLLAKKAVNTAIELKQLLEEKSNEFMS